MSTRRCFLAIITLVMLALLSAADSADNLTPKNEAEIRKSNQPTPVIDTTNQKSIADREAKIRELEAKIDKDLLLIQKRPRTRFVAHKMEPRFGNYVAQCLRKILQVSASSYPVEANGIYGRVQLTMFILAGGRVEKIEVNKSSGKKVLDETAVRFINLAAPFDQFPDDVLKDTDVLAVTRTFTFTTADDKKFSSDAPL